MVAMRTSRLLAAAAFLAAGLSISFCPAVAAPTRAAEPHPTATPAPDTAGLKFRAIGPAASGGRVTAVAGSDADPALYYVGGAGGGVFKSTDGGVSFTSTWEGPPFGAIGALAVAPSAPNVVWAGTGEANPRNDASFGDGVWVSRDGAKHWTHAGLTDTSQIAKILVDPRDPRRAIVAALGDPWKDSPARGVYRTVDGGKTWAHTLYVGPASGAADLAWNPHNPRLVFASIWQFRRQPWIATSGGPADGLYRSRDGGVTWTKVQGHGFPTDMLGRIGVAVAPSDGRRVYAVVQSRQGTVWRSDDGGDTWRKTSDDTRPEQRPFYFSHLAVDPQNRNRVISVSMYLTISKDGGSTWKHLVPSMHPDNHALWWSADGRRLIEGNDGGVILSRNRGEGWSFANTLPLAQIYHVGFDNGKPYTLCGGLQDNSSWCAPVTSRNGIGLIDRDWFAIAGGDGMYAIPDPLDSSLIWTNTQDGVLGIYDTKAHHSVDVSPYPRDAFTSLQSLAQMPYRFNWNAPLAFSPQDGHVAYFGGNVVFKTTDRGRHWSPISPDLTRNEKEHQRASGGPVSLDVSGAETYDTTLAIAPSPKDAATIWVGTDDGLVHLTRDEGAHWVNVTPKGWPRYGRVETIEASPYAVGTAFAILDRHDLGDRRPYAYVTDDFGATWRSIAANLPLDAPVRVLRQDPHVQTLLYAGTENGLWISADRGARWERVHSNLPRVAVYDVHVHPVTNDLLLATHGRGFYVLDDAAPLQQLAAARAAGTLFFPVREATVWSAWPSIEGGDGNALPANFYVGPNAPSGAVLTFYQKTKAKARPWIEILDAQGKAVRTLRGSYRTDEGKKFFVTNEAGINRIVWDGNEDGPTRWNGTSLPNAGPLTGAEALPGTYTARLHVDQYVAEQTFRLTDDPQVTWTADERAARHAFLATVFRWYDGVDRALNAIDARMKKASPDERARLVALRDELTSNAKYDEDSIGMPNRIRERLGGMAGTIGGALQPPFEQHREALRALVPDVTAAYRDIDTVLGEGFVTVGVPSP
ncbi:MAG: BNR/Asp-box repeat protein [Candidatus Eremiobacteraeota bacterium]|nr:BNR/Asp-box repeat protein [Candidatus Eremiobacteraeota bacterium]